MKTIKINIYKLKEYVLTWGELYQTLQPSKEDPR